MATKDDAITDGLAHGRWMARLKFFSPDGEELDEIIIWQSGNSSSIPRKAQWVEVSAIEQPLYRPS